MSMINIQWYATPHTVYLVYKLVGSRVEFQQASPVLVEWT